MNKIDISKTNSISIINSINKSINIEKIDDNDYVITTAIISPITAVSSCLPERKRSQGGVADY